MAKQAKQAKKASGATNAPLPRLKKSYRDEVVEKLSKEFGIENVSAVPRLEKVVLNMGIGEATQNVKVLDEAMEELAQLAGQRPVTTRAPKALAALKVREGEPVGGCVPLRGHGMC